jgi:hypothetical protein
MTLSTITKTKFDDFYCIALHCCPGIGVGSSNSIDYDR